jgi:hypothetical protein
VRGEGLGVLRRQWKRVDHGAHRGDTDGGGGGARCSREEGSVGFYSRAHRGERVACASRRGESKCGLRHGRSTAEGGGDVRATVGQWRKAVRPTGVCGHSAWHRPRSWRTSLLPCNSAPGADLGPAVSSIPRHAHAYGGDGG